eukprot:scaffold22577_cov122-Cylindrotheca_fusiformis.AAC.41
MGWFLLVMYKLRLLNDIRKNNVNVIANRWNVELGEYDFSAHFVIPEKNACLWVVETLLGTALKGGPVGGPLWAPRQLQLWLAPLSALHQIDPTLPTDSTTFTKSTSANPTSGILTHERGAKYHAFNGD